MSKNSCGVNIQISYDMRLSVEDSTEMPLLLTDLVKVVRPGAVTPVAAGMLMSRPTVRKYHAERSKKSYSIAWTIQDRDRSSLRMFVHEIPGYVLKL